MIPTGSLGKLPTCSKCGGMHRDLWCDIQSLKPLPQEPSLLSRLANALTIEHLTPHMSVKPNCTVCKLLAEYEAQRGGREGV